jgi:uncharacterized protein (TIGR02588 family)
MSENSKPEDGRSRRAEGTSLVEWLAAGVGAALFAAMIGYMIVVGLKETEGVPSVRISAETPVRQGDTFLVSFDARNEGNQTASGLVVRATLSQGETEIETSEVTIDYLPTGSTRSGGFFFRHDPQAYSLKLAPAGYVDP